MPKYLTRTVIALSLVSLFNDIASELLIPVMPFFLKSIGFTALMIGTLEGFAQVVVGLSTGYFGNLSDQMGKRMPFVRTGYFLSAISKSMMALLTYPWWIFTSRLFDRLGKGIRTSARDALLSQEAEDQHKGKVFGFHRAFDTVGAALGPVIALIYLYYHPGDYKYLFLIAFLPGLAAVSLTFLVREKTTPISSKKSVGFFSYFGYWKKSSTSYKKILVGLLSFAFFNSSDAFLFLATKAAGFSDLHIIGAYIFYNLVFAGMSFPAGALADKIGMRKSFITGVFFFALVYFGMSKIQNENLLYLLFFLYGIYGAFTDGISSAWISKNCTKEERGTALGFYKSFSSLFAFASSTFAGWLWIQFSSQVMFLFSASGAALVMIYFFTIRIK